MSIFVVPSSQRARHGETPYRWRQALERARSAGVQVRQLAGSGQWIVTSASDPGVAYETDGRTCTCAAGALYGDPVCLHRAALRAYLAPDPTPVALGTCAYDALTERLRWAENDRRRAWSDLDRFNAKIARDGSLSEVEYRGFLRAQERAQDADERIIAATTELAAVTAQNGKVAA